MKQQIIKCTFICIIIHGLEGRGKVGLCHMSNKEWAVKARGE
jgi:hypothetical protein